MEMDTLCTDNEKGDEIMIDMLDDDNDEIAKQLLQILGVLSVNYERAAMPLYKKRGLKSLGNAIQRNAWSNRHVLYLFSELNYIGSVALQQDALLDKRMSENLAALRNKAKNGEFSIHRVLPPAVFLQSAEDSDAGSSGKRLRNEG